MSRDESFIYKFSPSWVGFGLVWFGWLLVHHQDGWLKRGFQYREALALASRSLLLLLDWIASLVAIEFKMYN